MITKERFHEIRKEIQQAYVEVFEYARINEKNKNDYIQFLARVFYDETITNPRFTPWQVDRDLERILDHDRVEFVQQYLNEQYNFKDSQSTDTKYTLSIELMIYSHLWESQHHLSNLKKLADLCDSKPYDCAVKIPIDSKFKFVKNYIRDVLKKHNLKIYNIINDCYRSQFRNAFAHSLYHFSINGDFIVFENYGGENAIVQRISFDEWTEIFLKTVLTHHIFTEQLENAKLSLVHGQEYETTMHYNGNNSKGVIVYDSVKGNFYAAIK
jgi:hypothetical protein